MPKDILQVGPIQRGGSVKTDTGRLSADQIEFGRWAKEAGAQYEVVRSIEDVQQVGL
jgi:hypothetical protein